MTNSIRETRAKKTNGFSRRKMLHSSSAVAAAVAIGSGTNADVKKLLTPGAKSTNHDVFVQIFLRGAMDGLTTVVPHGDPDYYVARPNLAVPPPGQTNGALDLDGFFGLAPAAAPLMTPYQAGHLAFVHASGSIDTTRSHFDAFTKMEFGESGLPQGTVSEGWLSRYLIQVGAMSSGLLRAVGTDDILPKTLAGAPNTLPIPDMGNFLFPGNPSSAAERVASLTQMFGDENPPVGPSALRTFDSIDLMSQIDFAGYVPAGGAQYPSTRLGDQLRSTATLIKANVGVEAITIDFGSWDHHAQQGPLDGTMAAMLDDLARGLEAFYIDMAAMLNNVTVACISEFGRRVAENSSLGTDHGHGNVMLLMGGGINGGQVIANWPGLSAPQLDNGDLAITIDYRDILGEILDRRMGATDLAAIFPQHVFTTHGITV